MTAALMICVLWTLFWPSLAAIALWLFIMAVLAAIDWWRER